MTQKKKSSIDFDCICVTDVRISPIRQIEGLTHTKALAEVVFNDQLLIRGIKIREGDNGMFVSYPVDPFFKGEDMRSIAQPITRQLREHIENCILEKYQEISSQEA